MKRVSQLLKIGLPGLVVLAMLMPVGLASAQDDATPTATSKAAACTDGRMRVRDLDGADATLQAGIDVAKQAAVEWENDARLYLLQLRCPLLESGYEWGGTFFSEQAQAYWKSGTDESDAADDDPLTVRTLVTDNLSFRQLYRSLLRAGYSEDLEINISTGVTVRYNTKEHPFGPPNAPVNVILFHVAIEERGEVKDVWVSVDDGTVYRYA